MDPFAFGALLSSSENARLGLFSGVEDIYQKLDIYRNQSKFRDALPEAFRTAFGDRKLLSDEESSIFEKYGAQLDEIKARGGDISGLSRVRVQDLPGLLEQMKSQLAGRKLEDEYKEGVMKDEYDRARIAAQAQASLRSRLSSGGARPMITTSPLGITSAYAGGRLAAGGR